MEAEIGWWEVATLGGAVLLYGVGNAIEVALLVSHKSQLFQWQQQGRSGAAAAYHMREAPERFLNTVRVGMTGASMLAAVVAGARLIPWLMTRWPFADLAWWGMILALLLVICVLTYVMLVFGQLVPKALAQQYPERILCRFAGLVTVLARPCETIQAGLVASATVILRLFGQTSLPEFTPIPVTTEEDVTTLLREGAERGIFEPVEHELIAGVFEFTDTAAREIMVPRVDIKALEVTIPPDEVIRKLIETGHTRVPVYRGDLDHVVGILSLKDVLRAVDEGRPWTVRNLLHPPLYVPETAQISRLLRTLQQRRLNMAIVVDEHGGVAGLITIEDLVEQLVGDIQDEGEPIGEALVTQLPDGALVIQGRTPLWELRESFGLPVEETSDYQTLAGFLLARLGHIPQGGESITEADYTFTVVDMDGPRIARVKVERRALEGATELVAEPLPGEQPPQHNT